MAYANSKCECKGKDNLNFLIFYTSVMLFLQLISFPCGILIDWYLYSKSVFIFFISVLDTDVCTFVTFETTQFLLCIGHMVLGLYSIS